ITNEYAQDPRPKQVNFIVVALGWRGRGIFLLFLLETCRDIAKTHLGPPWAHGSIGAAFSWDIIRPGSSIRNLSAITVRARAKSLTPRFYEATCPALVSEYRESASRDREQ